MRDQSVSRFASIEGARAFMALWVVWGHLVQQAGINEKWAKGWEILTDATQPVFVFMIVSGFVITHLITEKKEPYLPYITRRLFRLAPLLWVCVGYIFAYTYFFPSVYRWDQSLNREYLIGYATMLHGVPPAEWVSDAPRSVLPPAWSVSLEWQFYLLAPLLLWRRAWPALIIAGAVTILLTQKNLRDWYGLTFDISFLPTSLGYFLIGIASYFVARRINGMSLPTWSILCAALVVWWATKGNYPLAVWVVVFGAAVSDNAIRRVLQTRLLVWLGTVSYSIYLVHMIVIMPIRKQLLEKVMGLQFGTWTYLWTMTVITVPIIILVSWLTWIAIERPGQRFGSWLSSKLATGGRHPAGQEKDTQNLLDSRVSTPRTSEKLPA